jgi:hypothetical protein
MATTKNHPAACIERLTNWVAVMHADHYGGHRETARRCAVNQAAAPLENQFEVALAALIALLLQPSDPLASISAAALPKHELTILIGLLAELLSASVGQFAAAADIDYIEAVARMSRVVRDHVSQATPPATS